MALRPHKRIADPIHATIPLSEVEIDVINTPAFQRLRNVRQLGLANLVFPSADYSRFAHSVGACHVMGMVADALNGGHLSDEEKQVHRLAALLHDVGHYPFSHTMEDAVRDYQAQSLVIPSGTPAPESAPGSPMSHEAVTQEIIKHDPKVAQAIRTYGLAPEDVASICSRAGGSLMNLVSSDLDVDRIDYLMRTAHHAGLPYGNIDLPYLVSQMRLVNGTPALDRRALRTAEHLLLARIFDYTQVVFHKTVMAFEEVLKRVIHRLFDLEFLNCSATQIVTQVHQGTWSSFDDITVWEAIRRLAGAPPATTADVALQECLVGRRPPALVLGMEEFQENRHVPDFEDQYQRLVSQHLPRWVAATGLATEYWFTCRRRLRITKAPLHVETSNVRALADDHVAQGVTVADGDKLKPLGDFPNSLVAPLMDRTLVVARAYVVLPANAPCTLEQIRKTAAQDNPWPQSKLEPVGV